MAGQVLDGRQVADDILSEVRGVTEALREETGARPGLALVRAAGDELSKRWSHIKEEAAKSCGIFFEEHVLPEMAGANTVTDLLQVINQRDDIHGILLQTPLPRHYLFEDVVGCIHPDKDIDCFHPLNLGRLMMGQPLFMPALAVAVMELLRRSQIRLAGREAVILGFPQNTLVRTLSLLLPKEAVTVTVCSPRTPKLEEKTRRGDILVTTGLEKPRSVRWDMVKDGAVVVDGGMGKAGDRAVGDVDFHAVRTRASAISPVPGGVGPLAVAAILRGTVLAAQRLLGGVQSSELSPESGVKAQDRSQVP